MIKIKNKNIIIFLLFFSFSIITNNQNAQETLIYGDDISYDKDQNIIAKGNAKIIHNNKIITSDLIIYSKKNDEIRLPIEFGLKDEKNNFYYGSNGFFNKNLDKATIDNVKILLSDGSRIVGKNAKRDKNIDIINKAVYTPCTSRIKIFGFICPIWQMDGEKMLHDSDNLFLYQKHSKMRVINLPVFYTPYIVTPSPLRKKRKSGFLTPSINLNFFDTKISQSTSLPYYFNLSIDKELTFTPTFNYGGGSDSSQRFNFDYNQLLSGGKFKSNLTIDSTFENQNNNKWLKEGSIINNYKKNINEKLNIEINSALQTSKNYIQRTIPNDDLSYASSLSSSLLLNRYDLRKIDDKLSFNIKTYHSNQNNEDNKTIPTILPSIKYNTGLYNFKNYNHYNLIEFYNIFRDTPTEIHSKSQRKLSSTIFIKNEHIKYATKIKYKANIYNQYFDVEDKKINNKYVESSYFRSFPIFGVDLETPFKFAKSKSNIIYTPKISLVMSPGQSNTNKISNEDSSINSYTIENNSSLNRFAGSDKLDNSKRVNLEFTLKNENISSKILQAYEFTNNSNFHYGQGNEKKLSDLLGVFNYNDKSFGTEYGIRYDHNNKFIKSQELSFNYDNKYGKFVAKYLDQKSKADEIIVSDNETMNYNFTSKKFRKYSNITYSGLYDLKKEINTENKLSYSYFDECFGINIDFKRNSYLEEELKPQDILTIMFSFKNIGSYKSTNLAVSEEGKQDIEWESMSIKNELFN